ncbi:glycosyltransferase [Falsiroseomonas sp.]|uniref:glycosyltransferase n=1 Tax=Falsiroseomonas sp. TaxID=2870721 RepID=UPI003F6E9786
MRILAISPTPSHPQDAGNRARIHAVLSALKAAGHAVHLCLLMRENPPPPALAAMRDAWDELVEVPHDRGREARSLGPLQAIDDWILPEAKAAFAALAARQPRFDLVLVNYVFLSRALTFFDHRTIKVIDAHDIFAGRAQALAAIGLENRFFATTAEEEAAGLDRADLVLAIQEEERRHFTLVTRAATATLGHLPVSNQPPPPPAEALSIGYIGSGNPLNTRALGRFLAALPPGEVAAAGGRVVVAGGACQGLAPAPGLQLLGPVADPDMLYAEAGLVVNPHEGGTGLKIKTVEALARGRPVIGTAAAFAGLPAEHVFHAAPDAAAVARLARRWLASAAFRDEVAEASARLFHRYALGVGAARARLASPAGLASILDRPRLLMLTDVPWWRGSLGNQARIGAVVEATREEFDLDLFFTGDLPGAEREAARRALGRRGRLFTPRPAGEAAMPWGLTPFEKPRFDGAVMASLEAHLARNPPQAVMVQYLRLSWMRLARGMPKLTVLDTHDVMSLRAQNFRLFGQEHFIQIPVAEELKILDGFAQVMAIQAEEARWLEALLPGRVILAPHALPALLPARGSPPGAQPRIGFIGGDSPMNRDGLRWLLDQVWPAIQPLGAELHVAGGVCAEMPKGRPGVVLLGEVADQQAFLDGLDIAVNPVFYGGGLKIKTVEYLARGLPSVLTAEALFGIQGGAGTAYALAENRAQFVAALALLVQDRAARARMAEAAFTFGRRHFGPQALAPAIGTLAALARGVPRLAPASIPA